MTEDIVIGVLGIQGDIEENIFACKKALQVSEIQGTVIQVKNLFELDKIDGLIIPGGESTVISTLLSLQSPNLKLLKQKINEGMPVLGTCAGMIILANRAYDKTIGDTKQELLKNLNVVVERNAFGRQLESFEADLDIPMIGDKPFKAVFIRGPIVKEIGEGVQIMATFNNKIVAVKQNNIIGTSFHPELTEDSRIHEFLIKLIIENKKHVNQESTNKG